MRGADKDRWVPCCGYSGWRCLSDSPTEDLCLLAREGEGPVGPNALGIEPGRDCSEAAPAEEGMVPKGYRGPDCPCLSFEYFRDRSPEGLLVLLDGEGPSFKRERGVGRDRPLSGMEDIDPGKKGRGKSKTPSPPTPIAGAGLKSMPSSLSSSPEKLQERSLSEAEEGDEGKSGSPGKERFGSSLCFFLTDTVEENLEWSSSANLFGSAAFILFEGENDEGR